MRRKNLEQLILDCAYSLFEERGFDQVSVNDICKACDITKPTFYKYVNSKEDLLSYFFQSLTSKIPDDWYRYDDSTNFWEKIVQGYCFFVDHVEKTGIDLYTAVYISNLHLYTGVFNDIPSFKALMIDLIQKAQETGQILNHSKAEDLYDTGTHLSIGYGAYWCFYNDPTVSLRDHFVNGLAQLYETDPALLEDCEKPE